MKIMRKLFRDIFTGIDNHTFDNGRVLCFASFFVFFTLAIINSVQGHSWGAMDFAGGDAAIAVGFGINLRLKRKTEPQRKKEHD